MTAGSSDAEVRAAIVAREPLVRETVRLIHDHTELAHAEHACAPHLADVLGGIGISVELAPGSC